MDIQKSLGKANPDLVCQCPTGKKLRTWVYYVCIYHNTRTELCVQGVPEAIILSLVCNNCFKCFITFIFSFSHYCVLCLSVNRDTLEVHFFRAAAVTTKPSDPSSPVKSLFEAFPLDVKLEDSPFAVSGGVVAPTVLLEERIKAVFGGVLLAAHEHHWDTGSRKGGERL